MNTSEFTALEYLAIKKAKIDFSNYPDSVRIDLPSLDGKERFAEQVGPGRNGARSYLDQLAMYVAEMESDKQRSSQVAPQNLPT